VRGGGSRVLLLLLLRITITTISLGGCNHD